MDCGAARRWGPACGTERRPSSQGSAPWTGVTARPLCPCCNPTQSRPACHFSSSRFGRAGNSAASATGMHGAKEPLGKDPGLALRSSSEIGNADRCQSLQTAPVMEMQSDDNKWLLRNWRCRGQRAHPQHGSLPSPSAALPPANCSANCCELRWVRAFG